MRVFVVVSLMIVVSGGAAYGYGFRLEQVPNGHFFDCTLCHNDFGGDTRNPFGEDVESTLTLQGNVDWAAIFWRDSDGDGFTNGEELGDPDGDGESEFGIDPSHPGDATSFPGADVALILRANREVVSAGETVTFTIDVFNQGSRGSTGVELVAEIPPGMSFVSASLSQGECEQTDGTVVCDLGEMDPQFGARATVRLQVSASQRDPISVSFAANVSGGEDNNPDNNAESIELTVLPGAAGSVFYRGDTNTDGQLDISDALYLFNSLFLAGSPLGCLEAADSNNDGSADISDGVHVLSFLYNGGAAPAPPGPPTVGDCGPDPDEPGSAGDLGCEAYPPCEA